jgi:hypothetical protein
MKQKDSSKRQKKTMKINRKISLQQFLPLSKAEIQGLLHPAEANLGYFLMWFQSLHLPSAQSQSPLASKSHVSFNVHAQLGTEFLFFSHISIQINCDWITEGLLYGII